MLFHKLRYNTRRIILHLRTFGIRSLCLNLLKRVKSRVYPYLWLYTVKTSPEQCISHSSKSPFDSFGYQYLLNSTINSIPKDNLKHITWIIPEFGPSSGGHRTIFRHTANLSRLGVHSTLAILEVGQTFSIEKAYANLPNDLDLSSVEVVMVKDIESIDRTFVATSWHTAYWARDLAEDSRYNAFYFIQDNESMFYPSGSLSLLALATYNLAYKHIYASSWLADTLSIHSHEQLRRVVDLGVDCKEFATSELVINNRRRRILSNRVLNLGIYYRPVTARRMEEHLYLLLEYISKNGLNLKLHFFGWDWSKFDWPVKSEWHENHGIVNHSDLGQFLSNLDCCLLFGSTNVSLMPLETIAAGLPTFVNSGANNLCLLKDLPIYISPLPHIGFQELSEFTNNREFLTRKMIAGINETKLLGWEQKSRQFYDHLFN